MQILSKKRFIFCISIIFAIGFLAGFVFSHFFNKNYLDPVIALQIGGYKFISPLLACNVNANEQSPQLKTLKDKLQQYVDDGVQQGILNTASIYFRDLKSVEQVSINGDEKFFPASLNKIPLAMAFYRMAQTDPTLMDKKITVPAGIDYNAMQEISPSDFAKGGETYKVHDLIVKMLEYSDNNSFNVLYQNVDQNILQSTYQDLQIQIPDPANQLDKSDTDFMTAYDASFFLRILYNATYLGKKSSEEMMEILSNTDFKEGLVAGVPPGTVVSHKFGLGYFVSYDSQDVESGALREFHDCGIIYHPNNPYLLCVMTKSSASLDDLEKFIQGASQLVYQEADNNYK